MRYWYVEFFDARGRLDHNAVCAGFDEIAKLAQGRTFIITGESTHDEWLDENS